VGASLFGSSSKVIFGLKTIGFLLIFGVLFILLLLNFSNKKFMTTNAEIEIVIVNNMLFGIKLSANYKKISLNAI